MRKIIAILVLAVVLAGCGNSRPRSIVYTDSQTGLSVTVSCEYAGFTDVRQDDTCRVWILEDGR